MPELPEVETVRRVLEPQIKGQRIKRIAVSRPEVVARPGADEFCRVLAGQTVERMERRGKFLILRLVSGDRVILHLRMTGSLLLTPADYPLEKHTHVVFYMENGEELRFSDTRRFGRFWLLRDGETDIYSGIGKLGKEPFDPGLTPGYLNEKLGRRKKAIKECLMEQGTIAGIGNIYADEILFEARIAPARRADSLSAEEWERLAAAIPERMAYFVEKNAVTPEEYLEMKGEDYRNTPFLRLYGHGGEPCPVCGQTLCRTVIGGRGSVYCPVCQGSFRTEEA